MAASGPPVPPTPVDPAVVAAKLAEEQALEKARADAKKAQEEEDAKNSKEEKEAAEARHREEEQRFWRGYGKALYDFQKSEAAKKKNTPPLLHLNPTTPVELDPGTYVAKYKDRERDAGWMFGLTIPLRKPASGKYQFTVSEMEDGNGGRKRYISMDTPFPDPAKHPRAFRHHMRVYFDAYLQQGKSKLTIDYPNCYKTNDAGKPVPDLDKIQKYLTPASLLESLREANLMSMSKTPMELEFGAVAQALYNGMPAGPQKDEITRLKNQLVEKRAKSICDWEITKLKDAKLPAAGPIPPDMQGALLGHIAAINQNSRGLAKANAADCKELSDRLQAIDGLLKAAPPAPAPPAPAAAPPTEAEKKQKEETEKKSKKLKEEMQKLQDLLKKREEALKEEAAAKPPAPPRPGKP